MRGVRGALVPLAGLACLVAAGAGVSAPERTSATSVRNGLIAFGSMATPSNEEIYVMNPDGSGRRRLTDQPRHDSGPVWSPDGRRIAFFSRRDGNTDIYVMNVDGSGLLRVTRSPSFDFTPTWSPDGTQRSRSCAFPHARVASPWTSMSSTSTEPESVV